MQFLTKSLTSKVHYKSISVDKNKYKNESKGNRIS